MKKTLTILAALILSAAVFTSCNPPAANNGGSDNGNGPINFPKQDEWTDVTSLSQVKDLRFKTVTSIASMGNNCYGVYKFGNTASDYKQGYYYDYSANASNPSFSWDLAKSQIKNHYGEDKVEFINSKYAFIVYQDMTISEADLLKVLNDYNFKINQNKTKIKTNINTTEQILELFYLD